MQQRHRVQLDPIFTQRRLHLHADRVMPHQPIAGRGWRAVPLDDPGAVPSFLHQLERWLEVVHVLSHRPVQVGHDLSGYRAGVAVMTDAVADHRAVLLLDPGLVVLAVGPRTGELDAPFSAVLGESIVDEYAVIVRVDAFDWEGQLSPDASSPATTRDCSRASSGTASAQPVQISVATRLWIMDPHQEPPWWTTRSISRNPGGGAFQSAKVRTGILRPGDCCLLRRSRRPAGVLMGWSSRSRVAALAASSR